MTEKEKETGRQVYAWECNLFAAPRGYFQSHTARELGISEEARTILIEKQAGYFKAGDGARPAADGQRR